MSEMKTYAELLSEALSSDRKDVRITVEVGRKETGQVYFQTDRWVAQLSGSPRSQSFTSMEAAIQALINYEG